MFGFKKKLARAGALVGVTAAVMAVGGIGASSAFAAPVCPQKEGGNDIVGRGATFQRVAQEVWTGMEVPTNPIANEKWNRPGLPFPTTETPPATGYTAACGEEANDPSASYGATGSGNGLSTFKFTGTGEIDHRISFIGTDDAPAEGAINNAIAEAGTNPVIIPVTQAAIALPVNLPAGCSFEKGQGITSLELNEIFGGAGITNWNQLEFTVGTCNKAITRVVRAEGSGTTFQFKHHLANIEESLGGEAPPCEPEGISTWAGLRPNTAGGKPNITWPECEGTTTVLRGNGNINVARKVVETDGAIGYGDLGAVNDANTEAEEEEVEVATKALLQNGEFFGSPTFAHPGGTTSECENAEYIVPEDARRGLGSGEAVDWSEVLGSNPEIGGETWPICTLTFLAAWTDYSEAGYQEAPENENEPTAEDAADVTEDYILRYILDAGQPELAGKGYGPLPSFGEAGSATNLIDAAKFAAEQINP